MEPHRSKIENQFSLQKLPKQVINEVKRTTDQIQNNWRRSTEGIIQVGLSLGRLKKLLPSSLYGNYLKTELGMSEMQAWRLITVAKKFGNFRSQKILSAKPSVLYLLASSAPTSKIDRLARGEKVQVNGRYKSIEELRVDEAQHLSKKGAKKKPFLDKSDYQIDRNRCKQAYRQVGTLTQDLIDWTEDITRFVDLRWEISNQKMLTESLRECRSAIDDVLGKLK